MASSGSGVWLISDGARPVRVMVCHWSRTRPVFSSNPPVAAHGGPGTRVGTNRARPSGVGNPPWANSRPPSLDAPAGSGQRNGCSAS